MQFRLRFSMASLLLALAPATHATQPLADTLVVGKDRGPIHPQNCCWLELPKTQRLVAAKRSEACTAIGGPVGRFELIGRQIWLVGLHRCSGEVPLEQIYPEMGRRTHAAWLNGVFFAKLHPLCFTSDGQPVYRTVLRLNVESGVATTLQRTELDESACRGAA